MSQIDQSILKTEIDNCYLNIEMRTAREQADMLYAIIGIKDNYKVFSSYKKPLYLDVKTFITEYLKAFMTEDYGYDIPNNEKLLNAINSLPYKEQIAMCRFARKSYEEYGYDTAFLDTKINDLQMRVARDEHQYLLYLLKWSGSNVKTLLISYALFVFVVYVVLLPSPFAWMGVLHVEITEFVANPIVNHLINTLAVVSGSDFAPMVFPNSLLGMLLIIFGKIMFYLLIVNFVVKKITDLFSFE